MVIQVFVLSVLTIATTNAILAGFLLYKVLFKWH